MLVGQDAHSSPCFCRRRYMALRLKPRALAAWLTLPPWRPSVRWIRWRSTSSRLMSSSRAVPLARVDRKPRSAPRTSGPVESSTPRSTAWSSSRTLPGQGCSCSALRSGGIEAGDILTITLSVAAEKVVRKRLDIVATFAQRRKMNLNGVQAKKQVLTKASGLRFGVYVGIGGREHANVYAAGVRGSDAF